MFCLCQAQGAAPVSRRGVAHHRGVKGFSNKGLGQPCWWLKVPRSSAVSKNKLCAVENTSSTDLTVDAPKEDTTPAGAEQERQDLDKQLSKLTRQAAGTFAPRPSGNVKKNPATKGTALYTMFEGQAWVSLAVGGLLAYNILFPTEAPSIPRLLGMWSVWMFTVPSLRARECTPKEKDALNILFVGLPLLNIALPFVWKSFGFVFTADVAALLGVYLWKDVFRDVYGLRLPS